MKLELPNLPNLPNLPELPKINIREFLVNFSARECYENAKTFVEDLSPGVKKGVVVVTVVMGTTTLVYFVYPAAFLKLNRRLARRKTGLKMKRIQNEDGTVTSYAERGCPEKSALTMLMIHGFGGSVDNWLPVAKLLPKEQHIIAIELPGHGNSSYKDDNELSMKGMAQRVLRFIDDDRSGLKRRHIHLIGAAMGGTVCAYFAGKWTSYVDCLTLIAPAMRSPIESDMVVAVRSGAKNPLEANSVADMRDALTYLVTEPPKLSHTILRGVLQLRRPYKTTLETVFDKMRLEIYEGTEDEYVGKYADKITVPTQVIWGEQDRICHVGGADELAKTLPQLVLKQIIPKMGHAIFMQGPQTLTTMLVTFQKTFLDPV